MKVTMHENGWTPIITDIDLRVATQAEINSIAELEGKHTVVVIKGQSLTPQDELRIAGMFGDIESFPSVGWHKGKLVKDTADSILRVTAMKDDEGNTGAWPEPDELDWHANNPGDPKRHSNIWLYGVEGTAGSATSYANTAMAYESLDEATKALYNDLKIHVRSYIAHSDADGNEQPFKSQTYGLVQENVFGNKGIWFPWCQVLDLIDTKQTMSSRRDKVKAIAQIKRLVLSPEFTYTHNWEDGDVVVADQWLSIHRRHPFERMDLRVLHRIATHFNNVIKSK
jgi:taurine dioxygenase